MSAGFGPWAPGLDPSEQRARLRSLRALARAYCGPRARDLCLRLAEAETDSGALEPAAQALDRLAPLDRRQVLGAYSGLARRM